MDKYIGKTIKIANRGDAVIKSAEAVGLGCGQNFEVIKKISVRTECGLCFTATHKALDKAIISAEDE